jgi:hypothetical protein
MRKIFRFIKNILPLLLILVGGCAQDNGTDFSVNVGTKEVSWSGLGLDGILEANDVLRISYSKNS